LSRVTPFVTFCGDKLKQRALFAHSFVIGSHNGIDRILARWMIGYA